MATYQGGQTIPGATSQTGGTFVFQGGQTIPSSTLPSIPTSGNGPTGVATSDLATNSIGAAQTNINNLQNSVANHAVTKAANAPGFDPTVSIVDLLTSKGMPSDFSTRSQMAAKFGVQNYTGSPQQNARLISLVNQQDSATSSNMANAGTTTTTTPTTNGGSSVSTVPNPPATSGNATTTSLSTAPVDYFQNTGAPGDVDNPQLNANMNALANGADQAEALTKSVLNQTIPLTPLQQSSMNAVTDAMHQATQLMMASMKSAQGIAGIAANRTGQAQSDPWETANNYNQTLLDTLNKIQDLNDDGAKTLGALQQSFMDSDMTAIMDGYNIMKGNLDDMNSAIEKNQDTANSYREWASDYSQKASEFNQQQAVATATAIAPFQSAILALQDIPANTTIKNLIGGQGKMFGFNTAKNKIISDFMAGADIPNSPDTTVGEVMNEAMANISTRTGQTQAQIQAQYENDSFNTGLSTGGSSGLSPATNALLNNIGGNIQ